MKNISDRLIYLEFIASNAKALALIVKAYPFVRVIEVFVNVD